MKLKRVGQVVLAVGLAAALGLPGLGVSSTGSDQKTVEGILVDIDCYLADPDHNKGSDHGQVKQCGILCAKMGKPVGLLTAKGKFYVLVVASRRLAYHMGQTLRVTGTLREGLLLLPAKLELKKGETWEEIKLGSLI